MPYHALAVFFSVVTFVLVFFGIMRYAPAPEPQASVRNGYPPMPEPLPPMPKPPPPPPYL